MTFAAPTATSLEAPSRSKQTAIQSVRTGARFTITTCSAVAFDAAAASGRIALLAPPLLAFACFLLPPLFFSMAGNLTILAAFFSTAFFAMAFPAEPRPSTTCCKD